MSETADQRIERDCIRGLFAQGRQASFIGVVIGAAIVAALWDNVSHTALLAWYALVVANQGIRVLMVRAFFAAGPDGPDASRIGAWARRYVYTMLVGGFLYGVTALVLWPASALSQLFLLMMVVGLAAGSIAANAFHPPTMYAYLTPLILPSILRLAFSGGFEYSLIATTNVFYYLMLVGFGRRQSALLRNSFALAYRNEDLALALQKKSQAAEEAQHAAEQASLAKSKFFAAASHDLRQPLHALGLFAASLRTTTRGTPAAEQVGQILSSVDVLESLFDELLDISKLDAGYVTPEPAHFAVAPVFARIAAVYAPTAARAGLTLRFMPTQAVLHSDASLVERALGNLVSNAIRYTPQGGVLVACRTRGRDYSLEVWDTGIGIADGDRERIFEEFTQLGNPGRDRSKGLGLGLATVGRIAGLLRTPVEVFSQVGRGSVFRLRVPGGDPALVTAPRALPREADVDALAGQVVVVIDDESAVREGMCTLFGQWQCRIVAAGTADEALAVLAERGLAPDLVIADFRLHDERTGIDAIAAIRARHGATIPAVLVSGDAAPETFRKAREAGLTLLTKPVRAARLRAALLHLLHKPG